MSAQFKFFSIPVNFESDAEAELNRFLTTVQLVNLQKQLICQQERFYWAIAIEYATDATTTGSKQNFSAKKKTDYKEVLSDEDFAVFAKLRDWRKETAAKEAVLVYNVFLNEHLAAMVDKRIATKAGLLEIDGVGDARVEKYGDAVLGILKEEFRNLEKKNEKGEKSVQSDPDPRKPAPGVSESGKK